MLCYKHTQINGSNNTSSSSLCTPDLPTSLAPSSHTHTHTLTHPLSQSVHGLLQYLFLFRREDIHANLHGGYKLLHLCRGSLLKILVGEDGLHIVWKLHVVHTCGILCREIYIMWCVCVHVCVSEGVCMYDCMCACVYLWVCEDSLFQPAVTGVQLYAVFYYYKMNWGTRTSAWERGTLWIHKPCTCTCNHILFSY